MLVHPGDRQLSVSLLLLACAVCWSGCAETTPPPQSPTSLPAKSSTTNPAGTYISPFGRAGPAIAHKGDGDSLKVVQAYRGRIGLGVSTPVPTPGGKSPAQEGLVLRDQKAYEAFISRIPKHRVQEKQPAPPSKDPLLKKPAIDFSKQMMIVALRHDMYVGPRVVKVTRFRDGVRVHVVLPDLGGTRMAARLHGMGTYHAVIVRRVSGTASFELEALPKKTPRP